MCKEIKPGTLNYAFCFISCLFTKGDFQLMSLLQLGKRNRCFPMSPNTKDLLNEYVWKSRGQRVSCWDFFPHSESLTQFHSQQDISSLHTQSSGLKTLHVSVGTSYDIRDSPEVWEDWGTVQLHGDGCSMTRNGFAQCAKYPPIFRRSPSPQDSPCVWLCSVACSLNNQGVHISLCIHLSYNNFNHSVIKILTLKTQNFC